VKPKAIYLVSEPATLIKGSGAYRHIEVGQEYLSQHFDLSFYPLCKVPDAQERDYHQGGFALKRKDTAWKQWLKQVGLWHTAKDLIRLFSNHLDIFRHYRHIKKQAPDFIYERSNFLNFQGILISKWLGIPHFYENNGIHYLEHQERVTTWLGWLWRLLERWAYQQADFVFFVGLWGNRIELASNNWMNIENGVELPFIEHFQDHQKVVEDTIHICFIGSLMKHHGLDVLIEALQKLATTSFHLHLIGTKLEVAAQQLRSILPTTYHGFLEREQLTILLEKMHVGVIPGGKEYPSFMKLFDYGAAKCLVIAPDLKNLQYWFNNQELLFFEKGNPLALKVQLQSVLDDPRLITERGAVLYQRIKAAFTWEHIFENKAQLIQSKLKGNQFPPTKAQDDSPTS